MRPHWFRPANAFALATLCVLFSAALPAQLPTQLPEGNALLAKGRADYVTMRVEFTRLLEEAVAVDAADPAAAAHAEYCATMLLRLLGEGGDSTSMAAVASARQAPLARHVPALSSRLGSLLLQARRDHGGELEALADELGVLRSFWICGPFDNERGAGYRRSHEPETRLDPDASYEGKIRAVTWPAGRIIPQRSGGGALVATADGIELTTLPADLERSQELAIRGTGTLSRSQLEIEAQIRMGGDEGFRAAEYFLQQPTNLQKQFARQFAQSLFGGWQIRDAEVAVLEAGKPVTVHATLRRRALQQDGDRLLLATPLPPGQVLARFGARPDRELPIRHTADFHLRWDLRLELEDVRLAVVPATTALQSGPLRYLQEVRVDGDTVILRRDTTMGSGQTPVSELGDWLAALQQVERVENGSLEFVAR